MNRINWKQLWAEFDKWALIRKGEFWTVKEWSEQQDKIQKLVEKQLRKGEK